MLQMINGQKPGEIPEPIGARIPFHTPKTAKKKKKKKKRKEKKNK